MVSSTTRKIISIAISLLVVVISLTGVAFGANVPAVANLTRYTPGFAGPPGKMVRDVAGNFYVTDFWGKGIVKLNKKGERVGFIATNGRPSAVAVLPDSRLVVGISKPVAKVAFYSQATGEEITATPFGAPAEPIYNPAGITIDDAVGVGKPYIYVVDSGDVGSSANNPDPANINVGKVRVYDSTGAYKYAFGARSTIGSDSSTEPLRSFKMPMGIAFEKVSRNIVVADTLNQRLQFFTAYDGVSCNNNKKLGGPAGYYGGDPQDDNTTIVRFADPADIAFEYNTLGTVLNRIYVAERGRGDVVAIDPVNEFSLKRVNKSLSTNYEMQYPSGLVFEKTTNSATSGVLYVSNAAGTNLANIFPIGIDTGTVPVVTNTMTMAAVPATSATSPISVTGQITAGNVVTCSVNGVAGGTPSAVTTTWTVSGLALQSGMNYILCQSTSGGEYKEANTYFGTPSTAPTVSITQPVATVYTVNSSVRVTGTTNPGNATVQLANSLGGTTTVQSDATGNWSADPALAEGNNVLTVTAWKQGTNVSSSVQATVVRDITPPNMSTGAGAISFLANNSITNNAIQNLDGIVVDANLASIEVNGVVLSAKEMVTLNSTDTYFSIPVTLDRGSNTVTVKAFDRAGNSAIVNRTSIMLKPEIPGITVDLPADNSYRSAVAPITASGTASSAFSTVNAAGTPVTPGAGVWSTAAMSTTAGFVSYQFTASGAGVDTVTEKRTINTGSYAQLAITYPAADLALDKNTSSVTIQGVVAGNFSPAPVITIDDAVTPEAVTLAGDYATSGKFSYTIATLSAGPHIIKVTAGTTSAIRHINRDMVVPDLTIQADSKPMPATISGSLEPSAKMSTITASLGGVPVVIPVSKVSFEPYDKSGSVVWHADLNGYAYDAISFTALDPAGNSTLLSYKQGIPTGDIDGDGVVRLADALAALRHVAGTATINPVTESNKYFNGDVGGLIQGHAARDGVIDITDSVLILNKAYGLLAF